MDPVVSISEHSEFLDRLGSSLPSVLDRLGQTAAYPSVKVPHPMCLRFAYRDVPFIGRVERQGETAILHLTGEIGPLPFSAQAALRRRRALITLAAGTSKTLAWRISARQEISVDGSIALAHPLTPAATVAGVVRLLIQAEPCLALLLDVLGDADELNSSMAA
jgi:hypothetical protein